jgi:hypothetical protein
MEPLIGLPIFNLVKSNTMKCWMPTSINALINPALSSDVPGSKEHRDRYLPFGISILAEKRASTV